MSSTVTQDNGPIGDALERPLLARFRERLIAAGFTVSSPDVLDEDAERLAREERWDLPAGGRETQLMDEADEACWLDESFTSLDAEHTPPF